MHSTSSRSFMITWRAISFQVFSSLHRSPFSRSSSLRYAPWYRLSLPEPMMVQWSLIPMTLYIAIIEAKTHEWCSRHLKIPRFEFTRIVRTWYLKCTFSFPASGDWIAGSGIDSSNHQYKLVKQLQSFADAVTLCSSNFGPNVQLLTITSEEEQNFVWESVVKKDPKIEVWLNLHRDSNGIFSSWQDGTPLTFTKWGQGEPSTKSQECAGMGQSQVGVQDDGSWNDGTTNAVCIELRCEVHDSM